MFGTPFLPLVVLVAGPLLQGPAPEEKLGGQSRRGKELMAAGRYAEAVPVYREMVAALPGNPGLLLNLGMALHLSGADQEAIPHLEAALRLQPDLMPASLFLGASHLGLGRPDAAVAPLQKVVRLQPDNGEARSMLVEALLGLERYAQAEPHLRRLAQAVPSDPKTWFALGTTYEELRGQAFQALMKQDPEGPFALVLVGDARRKRDQRNAAFHLYRLALERDPAFRGLHAAVAGIYRSAGHDEWAAVEEDRERRLPRPNCAREPLECGFAAGKYQEVAAAAAKSTTSRAYYWRVRAYDQLAEQAFARLTSLPPSVESHEWRAQVHRDERRYPESAEQWRRAVALAPEDPRLRIELAVTLRLNRDFAEAERVLQEALRRDPGAPEALSLMGDVLLAQQQPERAIPFLEKAVQAAPTAPPHDHGALGRAYALAGRSAEAIPHLQKSLPADADGSLRLQLGRAYQATGQAEQARRALKDYEEFRKQLQADAETEREGAALTPPDP
jgi:tetratricopeptide (TPR) repeat protein